MNKIFLPTYVSNDKFSFIVASAEIEGVHDLPLDINSFLGTFNFSSSLSSYGVVIIPFRLTSPLKYVRQVVKHVNERYNEHEIKTKKCAWGWLCINIENKKC